jgi:hypothetical protein
MEKEVYKPTRIKYRLAEEPTVLQRLTLEDWNKKYGDLFGVSMYYERKEQIQEAYYGHKIVVTYYLVIEHDPLRSGSQRPPQGRPPKILPPARVIRQRQMEGRSMAAMAKEYGVSRVTLYRHLSRKNAQKPPENDGNMPENVV